MTGGPRSQPDFVESQHVVLRLGHERRPRHAVTCHLHGTVRSLPAAFGQQTGVLFGPGVGQVIRPAQRLTITHTARRLIRGRLVLLFLIGEKLLPIVRDENREVA